MTKKANNNDVFKMLIKKYGVWGAIETIYSDVLYDYIKGVDTYAPVAREKLFDGDRLELQNRYLPSTFSLIAKSISFFADKVDFKDCNFVDWGSGKGKVLIGAAKFPFKKVKGVEFTEELHQIAEKNITRLKLSNTVYSYQGDAMNFNLEKDDQIFYFFNPFNGYILESCLQNIVRQKNDKPRYYIYVNPVDDEMFCKYFTKVAEKIIQPGNISVMFYQD